MRVVNHTDDILFTVHNLTLISFHEVDYLDIEAELVAITFASVIVKRNLLPVRPGLKEKTSVSYMPMFVEVDETYCSHQLVRCEELSHLRYAPFVRSCQYSKDTEARAASEKLFMQFFCVEDVEEL